MTSFAGSRVATARLNIESFVSPFKTGVPTFAYQQDAIALFRTAAAMLFKILRPSQHTFAVLNRYSRIESSYIESLKSKRRIFHEFTNVTGNLNFLSELI